MKKVFDFIIEHWEIISVLIYEILARIFPTKKNISILDNAMKIINFIIENKRKATGKELHAGNDSKGNLLNKIYVKTSKHILFVLLTIISINSFSQNPVYTQSRGLFLYNGSDTTSIKNTRTSLQNSTGNTGGLFYDKINNKWRVWNGSAWVNWNLFNTSGVGASFWPLVGSGIVTGDVTINSDNSGALKTLCIGCGDGGFSEFPFDNLILGFDTQFIIGKGSTGTPVVTVDNTGNVVVSNNSGAGELSMNTSELALRDIANGGGIEISGGDIGIVSATSNLFAVNATGAEFSDGSGSGPGIVYASDYSSTYVDRSLIDKAYADTKIDGTMAASRIPYGVDGNTLTTEAAFTYTAASNQLQIVDGQIDIATGAGITSTLLPNRLDIGIGVGTETQISGTGITPPTGSAILFSVLQTLTSGTYTPVSSNQVNLDAVTILNLSYSRVGSTVNLGGGILLDPTAAALTSIDLTLPVNSATLLLGGGAGACQNIATSLTQQSLSTFRISYTSTSTSLQEVRFSFVYNVN